MEIFPLPRSAALGAEFQAAAHQRSLPCAGALDIPEATYSLRQGRDEKPGQRYAFIDGEMLGLTKDFFRKGERDILFFHVFTCSTWTNGGSNHAASHELGRIQAGGSLGL